MKNNTFFKPEVPKNLATQPYALGDSLQIAVSEIYPYNRRHAENSILHSNVEDMLLWAKVYLNKGSINGKQIFSEESFKLSTSLHSPEGERKVCLSGFLGKMNDSEIYNHSGQDTGYKIFFGFMPEHKSAVVMMVNTDKFWVTNNAASILKKSVFNDTLRLKEPIHYKLKDYIFKDGIEK